MSQVRSYEGGSIVAQRSPTIMQDTGLSAQTFSDLRAMMEASITSGLAWSARVTPTNSGPGVAGKTGSAEWGDEGAPAHAWFVGFFPTEKPRLALAIIVEEGGSGPGISSLIASRIFASGAVQRYLDEDPGGLDVLVSTVP